MSNRESSSTDARYVLILAYDNGAAEFNGL